MYRQTLIAALVQLECICRVVLCWLTRLVSPPGSHDRKFELKTFGFCHHDTAMPHGGFTADNQAPRICMETARPTVYMYNYLSICMYNEETSRPLPNVD